MANNKLQMPTGYEVLNENEKSCVEGGGVISQIFYAFGRMFSGVYWNHEDSEDTALLCPKEMVFTPSRMDLPMRPLRRIPMALPVWAISSMVSATFLVSLADICDFWDLAG